MKATVFACVTAVLLFLSGCSSVPIPGAGRYVYQADPPRTVNYPASAAVAPPTSSGSAYAPPAYSPPGPYVNQGLTDRSAATQRATDMNWSIWRTNAMRSLRATEKAWTQITDKRYDRRDLSDVEYLQRWWTARGNDYCARVRAARNSISDRDYRDRCHAKVVDALHQLYAHPSYRHADEGNLALRKALARLGLGFEYPTFR